MLTTLSDAISDAGSALTSAGLVPASDTPAMSDTLQMQSDGDSKLMRGSLLRFKKDGATTYKVVPTTGDVCTYTSQLSSGREIAQIAVTSRSGATSTWGVTSHP